MAQPKRSVTNVNPPSREEVIDAIQHASFFDGWNLKAQRELEVKAFLCLLWLTGARVNELLLSKNRGWDSIKLDQVRPKDDVIVFKDIPIEKKYKRIKRPDGTREKIPLARFRDIRIPMNDFNIPFLEYIDKLCELREAQKEQQLFINMTRQRAYHFVKSLSPQWFPHLFRASRVTHLVRKVGMDSVELKQIFGWKDERPIAIYRHVTDEDIDKKMKEEKA